MHGVITFSCNLAVCFDTAYAQIEELVVDGAARGKQVGAALVRGRCTTLVPAGARRWVSFRRVTRGFYEGLGFDYVGVELRRRLD